LGLRNPSKERNFQSGSSRLSSHGCPLRSISVSDNPLILVTHSKSSQDENSIKSLFLFFLDNQNNPRALVTPMIPIVAFSLFIFTEFLVSKFPIIIQVPELKMPYFRLGTRTPWTEKFPNGYDGNALKRVFS
jgi:hypothetical protein